MTNPIDFKAWAAAGQQRAEAALDRVLAEVSEAERAIAEAQRAFVFDPKELEKSEERLFALRAAARKFKCTVDTLADVRERFLREGAEPIGSTPEAFSAFLVEDQAKWAKVIKAAGIKPSE